MMADTSLVYVGDPMCSWCWGFTPVVEELARSMPVEVVVGGLRPGPAAEPISERLVGFLRSEWAEIAERTGQTFDPGVLDRLGEGWLYDTEPPAMAVVQMRDARPDDTVRFFATLQRAFYVDGVDLTAPASYPTLLEEFDVDPEDFVAGLESDELRNRTWGDFARARRWGITGFPTLLARRGERLSLVTAGYRPYDEVAAAVGPM